MNYGAIVSYDGTRYEGWQKHEGKETVQGKLESVIKKVTGEEVQVIGAGRTDAGVHAVGQSINFHVSKFYDIKMLEREINDGLPDDIGVRNVIPREERFHSRFHAIEKTYLYRIRVGNEKDVFRRRFIWQYGKSLDVQKMKEAIPFLIGTHDFTSFCGQKKLKKSAVRTLFSIEIKEDRGILSLFFTGDGFLQYMVRILVGTLVEIGEGKRKAKDLPSLFLKKERSFSGFTAPPQGLTLFSVKYD